MNTTQLFGYTLGIAASLVEGFNQWDDLGLVKLKEKGDLVLFNYTKKAQYERQWTPLERISRGLIIHRITGEIVALPFEKFFNWGEDGRQSKGHMVHVANKMDGSLGILYRDAGKLKIATRGSFESDQALWATHYLHNNNLDLWCIPNELTLLFEIIYPENKVVLDYEEERLTLIGARNRFSGKYLSYASLHQIAMTVGLDVVDMVQVNDVSELLAWCKEVEGKEGWVVEFSDDLRFKFKTDWYVNRHRAISHFSPKRVAEWWKVGEHHTQISSLPDELYDEARAIVKDLELTYYAYLNQVNGWYDLLQKENLPTRKEQALWVKAQAPKQYDSFLFGLLDKKSIKPKLKQLVIDDCLQMIKD